MTVEKINAVNLVVLKKDILKVLEVLQLQGIFHVEQKAISTDLQEYHTIDDLDTVANALLSTKWLQQHLSIEDPSSNTIFSGLSVQNIVSQVSTLKKELQTHVSMLSQKKDSLEKDIEFARKQVSICSKIPFNVKKLQHTGSYSFYIIVQLPELQKGETHDVIFNSLKHINSLSIKTKKNWALICGESKHAEKTFEELQAANILLDSDCVIKNSSFNDSKTYPSLITLLEHNLLETKEALQELTAEYSTDIQQILCDLKVYHARFEIGSEMHTTAHTCILQGFVANRDVNKLRLLQKVAPVTIETKRVTEGPTKLHNLPYIRNYELVTEMFGLPNLGKTDPTAIMSIFIPFFFGLMFSDVGYGVILLLTSFLLLIASIKKRNSAIHDASIILNVCAISTILFGILFGSFFGTLIKITPLLFDPFQNAQYLLVVALGIGLIHLNLAHLVGLYEYIRAKEWKTVLENTGSFVAMEAGVAMLFVNKRIGYVLIALSVALFIKKSSLQGIMDVSGLFGTWFSYARILALSLATGGIALGINIMAKELGSLGTVGIILSIVLLIAGHAFNYILNLLGCTIHSVRLHFVEFFSQYYDPGGKAFKVYGTKD
jgi:vacuolar-type H+-ATPase subunit I/STV1